LVKVYMKNYEKEVAFEENRKKRLISAKDKE
jgi:hypothetical protein